MMSNCVNLPCIQISHENEPKIFQDVYVNSPISLNDQCLIGGSEIRSSRHFLENEYLSKYSGTLINPAYRLDAGFVDAYNIPSEKERMLKIEEIDQLTPSIENIYGKDSRTYQCSVIPDYSSSTPFTPWTNVASKHPKKKLPKNKIKLNINTTVPADNKLTSSHVTDDDIYCDPTQKKIALIVNRIDELFSKCFSLKSQSERRGVLTQLNKEARNFMRESQMSDLSISKSYISQLASNLFDQIGFAFNSDFFRGKFILIYILYNLDKELLKNIKPLPQDNPSESCRRRNKFSSAPKYDSMKSLLASLRECYDRYKKKIMIPSITSLTC